MSLTATYYGANGWLVKIGEKRILIDPWLRGELNVIPSAPFLFRGELNKELKIPKTIDLLVLTQGIEDHTHKTTLELLPKSIPVIASSNAAKKAISFGFSDVYSLSSGEFKKILGLIITATKGAPVPNFENGYLIESGQHSIYIEPHGYLDEEIKGRRLDAVISPVVDLGLPLIGAFINGKEIAPKLVEKFNPRYFLASTTGGEIKFSGILSNFIVQKGSAEEAKKDLKQKTKFIDPIPGKEYALL